MNGLYFKIPRKLFWYLVWYAIFLMVPNNFYIISSFIITIMTWTFFLIDSIYNINEMEKILPENLESVEVIKNFLFYFISAKSCFYLISFILTIIEKNKINTEMNDSLFKQIDDSLTQDVYNSILDQCKFPDDEKQKEIKANIIKKRGIERNRISEVNRTSDFSDLSKTTDSMKKPLIKEVNNYKN